MVRRPKHEIHVTRAARRDLIAIMHLSLKEFGVDAAHRYDALMTQALSDIAADPERPGVQQRSELAEGVLVYHLRFSRDRAKSGRGVVHNPRHSVIYRRRDRAPVIDITAALTDEWIILCRTVIGARFGRLLPPHSPAANGDTIHAYRSNPEKDARRLTQADAT